ncbi:MAG: F0F1 ATP synthase subunit A [Acidimicrobiales bacterium]
MGLTSLLSTPLSASDITVGVHPQAKWGPLTVNVDIVWATLIASAIVITFGLILRAKATSGVPSKFQLCWEIAVGAVQKQVNDSIGPRGAQVVPLAITIFVLIFTCNLFEVLGIGSTYEFLPAPTSDINLPAAMAVTVFVLTNAAAIRNRGVGGYVSHFLKQPFSPVLFPVNLFMNVIEEVVRPITLTLRLFGNLFAGGLMLALLAALVDWRLASVPIGGILSVLFTVIWKLFDMGIGAIQAFIFALLTIIYFETAMSTDVAH